jgi:hypothetical protein
LRSREVLLRAEEGRGKRGFRWWRARGRGFEQARARLDSSFLLAHGFLGLLTSRRRARQPRSGLGWWPVGARRAGRLLIQRGAPVHSQVAVAGGARGCGSKFFPGAEEAVPSQRLLRDGCATLRVPVASLPRVSLVLLDSSLPLPPGPRVAVLTDAPATGTGCRAVPLHHFGCRSVCPVAQRRRRG